MMTGFRSLPAWFAAGAGTRPALVTPDGHRTYRELDVAAGRIAAGLDRRLGRPRRVAVLGERLTATYEAYLGALYAGATVVPVNPEYPDERIVEQLRLAHPDCLIYDGSARALCDSTLLTRLVTELPELARFELADLRGEAGPVRRFDADPSDTAYLVFTSGSSGRPKGVPISHRNIDAYLQAMQAHFEPSETDVFAQIHELTFDFSVLELWLGWSAGGCVHAIPRVHALDPVRAIKHRGITFFCATPSLIAAAAERDRLPADAVSSLRVTAFCGEPLPTRVARAWQAVAPAARLENLYGPTEATVSCTGHTWRDRTDERGVVSIGTPHRDVRVLVLDEDDRPAPIGELCVSGPQVFDGYLDPADDLGRFIEVDGVRWYRTGDRVERDVDGDLHHLGRIDRQVKVRGYRIELSELEAAARPVCGGADVIALDLPDPVFGTRLAVFVADPAVDTAAVRAAIVAALPGYMVPAEIRALTGFPMNSRGKVDRSALRALLDQAVSVMPVNPDAACGPMIEYSNMP